MQEVPVGLLSIVTPLSRLFHRSDFVEIENQDAVVVYFGRDEGEVSVGRIA